MRKIWMTGCVLPAVAFMLPAQEPVQFSPAAVVAAGKVVTGAPFSAVEVRTLTQTLPDGSRIVRNVQRKVYRDSHGRERADSMQDNTVGVLGEQIPVASGMISDPVAGVTYNINPPTRSVLKMPGAHFSVANGGIVPSLSRSAVPVKEQLAPQTIEGVYAQGTRTTTTIPAGQIGNEKDLSVVDEAWYSADLQLNVMTRHSDPRSGETLYQLTNIVRAEPDASLFQVPAGYTVKEPKPTTFLMDVPPPPPPPAK